MPPRRKWSSGPLPRAFAARRFSPGYGDLPLSLQPAMLRLTGADRMLGVQAGPSFLMTPMKSVTAVVGLAPENVEGRRAGYGRTAHA